MKRIFEKSIVAAVDIPKGAVLTADMLTVKKPGNGLAPARLSEIIGRRAARAIPADRLLALDDLAAP
jgi:sialic acid synthase SpsE